MLGCRTARTVSSARFFFRSVRTYMSIENVSGLSSRSVRTLITSVTSEWKRLRSFRTLAFFMSRRAIDMQVLTDLKRKELVSDCAVRDRAIPNYRDVMLGEGQALALRFARGPPSRGGLSPAMLDGGEGQALALRARGRFLTPRLGHHFRINILPVAMNSPAVSV